MSLIFKASTPKYKRLENVYDPVKTNVQNTQISGVIASADILQTVESMMSACKGDVDDAFIRRAVRNTHYYIVAFDHTTQDICGFLLLHHYHSWSPKLGNHTFGYVDLVCSKCKGTGTTLMKRAESFCKTVLKCKYIKLNALDESIGFYERIGYEHKQQPCFQQTTERNRSYTRNRQSKQKLNVNNLGVKMSKCLLNKKIFY